MTGVKISDMTEATSVADTDQFEMAQDAGGGNWNTRRITWANIKAAAQALVGSNGLIARTGSGTFAARTLTGTTDQITVTDGNGVDGNPTLALSFANQATAEAGTDTVSPVNSLGVAQAIAAQVPAPLVMHRGFVALTNTTAVEFLDLAPFKVLKGDCYLAGDSAISVLNTKLQARYSNNNGSSWGSWQDIGAANVLLQSTNITSDVRGFFGNLHIDLVTGVFAIHGVRGTVSSSEAARLVVATGTHTVPSDCDAVGFRFDTNSTSGRIYLNALSLK